MAYGRCRAQAIPSASYSRWVEESEHAAAVGRLAEAAHARQTNRAHSWAARPRCGRSARVAGRGGSAAFAASRRRRLRVEVSAPSSASRAHRAPRPRAAGRSPDRHWSPGCGSRRLSGSPPDIGQRRRRRLDGARAGAPSRRPVFVPRRKSRASASRWRPCSSTARQGDEMTCAPATSRGHRWLRRRLPPVACSSCGGDDSSLVYLADC